MALRIDKLRFRNVLVRGDVLEAPAIEFADALDDTFQEQLEGLASQQGVESAIRGVRQDIRAAVSEIKADAAEREARITRNQLVMVGVILGGIALAVAILLGLLL